MIDKKLANNIKDFNNRSSISASEFRAWLSGFVTAKDIDNLDSSDIGIILNMVTKIQEDKVYLPSSPQLPLTPHIWPNIAEPYTTPKYPGIPPIWCSSEPAVGGDFTTGAYKITKGNTDGC